MNDDCCEAHPERYEAAEVKELPELRDKLVEVEVNVYTWTTTFRCARCGQTWEEVFLGRGHGEVPLVRKAPPVSAIDEEQSKPS